MRVLLDECLPRRLKREFAGHDSTTVPEMEWAGKRNGELLELATAHNLTSSSRSIEISQISRTYQDLISPLLC